MSTLETFVLPYLIAPHRPMTFVVKKSLVEYPVFKHVMRARGIPLWWVGKTRGRICAR
jgi:1-acyl-sn-glycerol-3-phosphate acyltransferase